MKTELLPIIKKYVEGTTLSGEEIGIIASKFIQELYLREPKATELAQIIMHVQRGLFNLEQAVAYFAPRCGVIITTVHDVHGNVLRRDIRYE